MNRYNELRQKASPPLCWPTDTVYAALLKAAAAPNKADSDPCFGAGGTQNYATNECTAGGNYTAGGIAVSGMAVNVSGGVTYLDATAPGCAFASNAGNPTNARYVAFYSSTDANKHVFCIVDLGADTDTTIGFGLQFNSGASGTQHVASITP